MAGLIGERAGGAPGLRSTCRTDRGPAAESTAGSNRKPTAGRRRWDSATACSGGAIRAQTCCARLDALDPAANARFGRIVERRAFAALTSAASPDGAWKPIQMDAARCSKPRPAREAFQPVFASPARLDRGTRSNSSAPAA